MLFFCILIVLYILFLVGCLICFDFELFVEFFFFEKLFKLKVVLGFEILVVLIFFDCLCLGFL